ncbi:hypothetical protein A3Q56_04127 [Intoshia linei]|uniref:Uncharacterized protein n=1 Tax=Intoshia linei TaxID=1819745 RepID=A0A177B3D9_9BILA|nr:hypothetical protein A3Q56_04127 [Intoshia linei]
MIVIYDNKTSGESTEDKFHIYLLQKLIKLNSTTLHLFIISYIYISQKYSRKYLRIYLKLICQHYKVSLTCKELTWIQIHIGNTHAVLIHKCPYTNINYKSNDIFMYLLHLHATLSERWSLLSTLGGGHSCLGEKSDSHALVAGKLAIEQFRHSKLILDESFQRRCYLYYALSLCQLKKFKDALHIAKKQYKWTKKNCSTNSLMVNSCKGVISVIKEKHYLYNYEIGRKMK